MQITFLSLRTAALTKTMWFYMNDLGLPRITWGEGFAVFQAGETMLMFEDAPEPEDRPYYHFAFEIPRNRLEQAEAWLSERVELLPLDGKTIIPIDAWNAASVYFRDPSGNVVEFIARQNLENDSDEDFSASSILRVSELGWPCIMAIPDRDFGLPVWFETDKFQALGSETGLILVVGNNRPWMPTSVPAVAHPSSVVIRDEKGTRGFYRV